MPVVCFAGLAHNLFPAKQDAHLTRRAFHTPWYHRGMASSPLVFLVFRLAMATNPLIWLFAILRLTNNRGRFSVRTLLVAMTMVALLLGVAACVGRLLSSQDNKVHRDYQTGF